MGILRLIGKRKPAYVITLSPTPAGKTWTTEGRLISTPGTPYRAGYSVRREAARQEAARKAAAKAKAVAEAKARAELERARQEAIRKEAARKAAAKAAFDRAFASAKVRRSVAAQQRARDIFQRAQTTATKEKTSILSRISESFKESIRARAPPKITIPSFKKVDGRVVDFDSPTGRVVDFLSGGYFTEAGLKKDQTSLNKGIEAFNKQYGGRELSESEFRRAEAEARAISKKGSKLEKDFKTFEESPKRKLGRVVYDPVWGRKGSKIEYPKFMSSAFIKLEKFNINKYNKLVANAQSNYNKNPTATNKRKLDSFKNNLNRANQNLNSLKGNINPYLSPSLLDVVSTTLSAYSLGEGAKIGKKVTDVKFIGEQKFVGNKIITDLAFYADDGARIGKATGVTVTRGAGGKTLVFGKSGVPSIKLTVKDVQAFVGVEKVGIKPSTFKLVKEVKIGGKLFKITKNNIEGFSELGLGRVLTAKGTRVFKIGKVSANIDDFVSVSASIPKDDLSFIIGNAITSSKDKTKFMGFIKGSSSMGKAYTLTGVQQQQYNAALKKVLGVVGASLSKSKTISGLTHAQKLAYSVSIIKSSTRQKVILKPPVITKVKVKVVPALAPQQVTKTKVKQGITQISKQQQKVKQKIAQITRARQKAKTKVAQRSLQQQRQKLRMRLKLLQIQKNVLTSIRISPKFVPTAKQMRVLLLALPKIKKRVKRKVKKAKARSYHVHARPLRKKGRKKPKLIRVTKRPIKKRRAKDLRNYLVDTSLSRTAKIKPSPKKPSKRILKAPTGYASKTKKKFRKYKIVKGKRKTLPSGKVIERRKHLLDTKQEKKQITLRKRIAQLQKQSRSPTRTKIKTPQMPLKLKKLKRTVIKKAPKGQKPTRWRFKGNQRLGFRNNKVVEIVKFNPRRKNPTTPLQSNYKKLRKTIKRKASPAQLAALAKGRKILAKRRKR